MKAVIVSCLFASALLLTGCNEKPAKMDVPQGKVIGAINDPNDRVQVNVYQLKNEDGTTVTVAYDVKTGQTSILPGPLTPGGKVEVPTAPKPAEPKPEEKKDGPKKVETITTTETRVVPPPMPAPPADKK